MRKKSRFGAVLGALCLSMSVIAAAGAPQVRAEKEADASVNAPAASGAQTTIPAISISVGEEQKTPRYKAGEESVLSIRITNRGTASAQHVKITPNLEDQKSWPFVIGEMNYERSLPDIDPGKTQEAKWTFRSRDDIETGMYRLDFQIRYDDGKDQYQTGKYIYVHMEGKQKENTNSAEETKNGGKNANTDAGTASFVPAGESVTPPVGDAGGVVNTGAGEESNPSVPRVIVTGFSTDPKEVLAGSSFRLIVHVKNTASWTAVSNMLFDFQAPSSGTDAAAEAPAFLPASGSSSVYFDAIPAGETRDIAIDLTSRADLAQKPYSITMTVKYEDGKAAGFDSSASLAIPVVQKAKFDFSDIELAPADISVGQEANLTCSLYNTGRVKLYNVKASFTGEGIEGKEVFVGNLEPGATGAVDAMLSGTQETFAENNAKLVITYEDETGRQSQAEKAFTLMVGPAAAVDEFPMPEEPAATPFPKALAASVAVLVLLAAAAVIWIIKRKKKNRRMQEEEELLDEVDRFIEDEHTEP